MRVLMQRDRIEVTIREGRREMWIRQISGHGEEVIISVPWDSWETFHEMIGHAMLDEPEADDAN